MKNVQIDSFVSQIIQMREDLPNEYYYTCLPLCIIDAVFSIGAKYKSTQNAVWYFAEKNKIHLDRRTGESHFDIDSLMNAYAKLDGKDEREVADTLFNNKQRTSPRYGITKAEAVRLCARLFQTNKIQTIDDFREKLTPEIENEFRAIPGQHSGISLTYLKMLCGNDDLIKPDRHVVRFFDLNYDKEEDRSQAQMIVNEIVKKLKGSDPNITARTVDYWIWNAMRNQ